ncbi:hypothetical protein L7F22_062511 [Adiantum nelumboides]|nr:hypothetical protein [Adiantum nelumboides]
MMLRFSRQTLQLAYLRRPESRRVNFIAQCSLSSASLDDSADSKAAMASSSAEATWNGVVLASSEKFEMVEGNVYFPSSSVNMQYMKPSSTHTFCDWKGDCSYYTVEVDGKQNKDAAWFYPSPYPAAANIKDHIAFWKGVTVQKRP